MKTDEQKKEYNGIFRGEVEELRKTSMYKYIFLNISCMARNRTLVVGEIPCRDVMGFTAQILQHCRGGYFVFENERYSINVDHTCVCVYARVHMNVGIYITKWFPVSLVPFIQPTWGVFILRK